MVSRGGGGGGDGVLHVASSSGVERSGGAVVGVAAAVHVTALLDGAVCYLFAEATRQ